MHDLQKLLPEFGAAQEVPELRAIPQKVVRIPLSGNAPLTSRVKRLLSSDLVSRLRRHLQLGTISEVYPGVATSDSSIRSASLRRSATIQSAVFGPVERLLADLYRSRGCRSPTAGRAPARRRPSGLRPLSRGNGRSLQQLYARKLRPGRAGRRPRRSTDGAGLAVEKERTSGSQSTFRFGCRQLGGDGAAAGILARAASILAESKDGARAEPAPYSRQRLNSCASLRKS